MVNARQSARDPGKRPARSRVRRELLDACRSRLTERLLEALPRMLDQVDDALFDLAEKADSNRLQSVYFEAMRDARLRRAHITSIFRRELIRAVEQGLRSRPAAPSLADLDASELSLVLVEDDDLEKSLAVTNMVAKVRGQYHQELFALDRRIGFLLGEPALESADNPLGPETVCGAFRTACDELDACIEVKLIVLKLFDRHVIGDVGAVYQELNELLIREGVVPHLRTEVERNRGRQSGSVTAAGAGVAQPGFSQAWPAGGMAVPVAPGIAVPGEPFVQTFAQGAVPGDAQGAAQGPAEHAQRDAALLDTLHHLMNVHGGAQQACGPGGIRFVDHLTGIQVAAHGETALGAEAGAPAGTANVLRALRDSQEAAGMERLDQLLIDVVAMMFDFILDDEDLPSAMKALIGRLQIPVLKVAILDKSFFARKHHPARQLLNVLAGAAVGWNEQDAEEGGLAAGVEALVRRILEDFEDDVGLFAEVLAELEDMLAGGDHEAQANAERSARVAEGRERLARAKEAAECEIIARLEQPGLPHVVARFLSAHWKELLVMRYVHEGPEGESWQRALDTMDDLVCSVLHGGDDAARAEVLQGLAGLVERLKAGLEELGVPRQERAGFLGEFANLHLEIVRREVEPTGERPATAPPEKAPVADAGTTSQRPASRAEEEATGLAPRLRGAVEQANREIHETAQIRAQCRGMGTTVAVAWFAGDEVTLAHVGDSRIYRLRNQQLEQLTTDHSMREELVARGFYTPAEAAEKVPSNIITRALGTEPAVTVDVQVLPSVPGDVYLACSDGLTDMIADEAIERVLTERPLVDSAALEGAALALVEAANDAGGRDNISVGLALVPARPATSKAAPESSEAIEVAALTDVGRRRSHNEDCVQYRPGSGLVVLADGMGGYNAGEVASAMAVRIIVDELEQDAFQDTAAASAGDAETSEGFDFSAINALFWEDGWAPAEGGGAPGVEAEHGDASSDHGSLAELDSYRIEEIVLDSAESAQDEEGQRYIEAVRQLKIGTWVEFRDAHRDPVCARLTWLSSATGKYLFTDRAGLKVAESTAHGLAVELRRGTARVVENVPLFDRAVDAITRGVRSPAEDTT